MLLLTRLCKPARGFPDTRPFLPSQWLFLILVWSLAVVVRGMGEEELSALRLDTISVFYHGFDNYMEFAFPEDELKPITCTPLTRDQEHPAHIEVNDVLGNYSLTLIDSLSTLAILASSSELALAERQPFYDFQDGVKALVELYGDGTSGPAGEGSRSRGFDLDSKVQVFETVIRGLGGLLSAHLFAVGELPITGYNPPDTVRTLSSSFKTGRVTWDNGFVYDGQLLRLALDLGRRLLPAFETATGLPYPRVNLRHGVSFYPNSPLNYDSERGQCKRTDNDAPEITETCSAGAGSLVLEFVTLSRLTGLDEFERAGRRAFWAVWERRSSLGLIGAGVDAESGRWVSPYTGIGAGIDSFFEYALKTHILLSGSPDIPTASEDDTIDGFLSVWQEAHGNIKRHLYRSSAYQHPHYIQADLFTGAHRAFWIDSLSAYYPGLLTLGGQLDEAIETHLLYTALWSRYSALPERWSTVSGKIESGLRWWGGRPEFIESTWYLYQATQDPWYLYIGEMALFDIQRRCWTRCGWAGLEDVRTGEQKDRMESFFLGETVQYLYLLFDPSHPLNRLDAPFVFTTEGHPLILPKVPRKPVKSDTVPAVQSVSYGFVSMQLCPTPAASIPFTISAMASRKDIFHAASLARLYSLRDLDEPTESLREVISDHPSLVEQRIYSPTNYIYFPWTLPAEYVPQNGTSARMETMETFDLSFPTLSESVLGSLTLRRVDNGILMPSISGMKISLIREMGHLEVDGKSQKLEVFRVTAVAQATLGRDEMVYITREAANNLNPADQYFTRHRDLATVDLIVESPPVIPVPAPTPIHHSSSADANLTAGHANTADGHIMDVASELLSNAEAVAGQGGFFQSLLQHLTAAIEQHRQHVDMLPTASSTSGKSSTQPTRIQIAAANAVGAGAALLPEVEDASLDIATALPWAIIEGQHTGCAKVPLSVPRDNQVLILRRGECNFAEKLQSIPAHAASPTSLQLVIVVSDPSQDEPAGGFGTQMARPFLAEEQTYNGSQRRQPIPLVMVDGGDEMYDTLQNAARIGLRRRYFYSSQGLRISNLVVL